MSDLLYDTINERFLSCHADLKRNQESRAAIDRFRDSCLLLLQEFEDADSDSPNAFCKLGIQIAADVMLTRICTEHGDGFKIQQPYTCPPAQHSYCLQIYDRLLTLVKDRDRMYMAPGITRDPSDPQAKLAALRRFDLQQAEADHQRDASNKNINRLFGSRG